MTKGWKIAITFAVILFFLSLWKRKAIVEAISGGIVTTPPETLAKQDGVTVDVESLARAMESEESSATARTAIGWAIKNKANRSKISITKLVTQSKGKANGLYSRQDVSGGKYCTTYKSPSKSTLGLAQSIFSGTIPDPTKGAIQWDAPKTQDASHAKNPSKFKTSAEIAASRLGEGRKLVMVEGVPNTRFWA